MSDINPVKKSELVEVFDLLTSDEIDILRSSDNFRLALGSLILQPTILDTDEIYIIRSGNIFRAPASSMSGHYLREIFMSLGNARVPSVNFPAFCLTNYTGSAALSVSDWPLLVPDLRDQTIVYLEGLTGQTSVFPGTVSGSVFTLDDTVANNALFAALEEDQAAFGTFTNWRTMDIDGVTFSMSALTAPRAITVTGSPSTGTQNATFYPHRIAGSTTTARLISLIGRTPVGPGAGGVISGLLRRDQMQQITGSFQLKQNVSDSTLRSNATGSFTHNGGTGSNSTQITATGSAPADEILFNSANSPNARTGTNTHGPDFGAHLYIEGNTFVP